MISYTEIHLVEHCNLNCAGCCHCSCLAKPEFLDIQEFIDTAKRMAELTIDEKRYTFCLMGGEPLLHPQFLEFCKVAREIFPSREIRVLSNGLLLTKQPQEFFDTVNSLNIRFLITKYPYNYPDNFNSYLKKLKHVFMNYTDKFFNSAFCLAGNRDKKYEFNNCHQIYINSRGEGEFSCALLKHGKIYPCSMAGNSKILKDYFNLNIEDEQGLDIFTHTKEEIEYYLFHPCNFCKYCNVDYRYNNLHEHSITKKDLGEWVIER